MFTGIMLLAVAAFNIVPWVIILFVGFDASWEKELHYLMTTDGDMGFIFYVTMVAGIYSFVCGILSFSLKKTKGTRLLLLALCVLQPLVLSFFVVLAWDVWLMYAATVVVAYLEYKPHRGDALKVS